MKMIAHRLGSAWIWALIAVTQLLILLWWSRWIIDVKYDRPALTDLYDHSQWVVPQSPRLMGDAELYQVSGDDIWRAGEFFRVNPETPPFGKYVYGAAINLTNRPYLGTIAIFGTTLFLSAILCFNLFPHNRRQAIVISSSLLLGNQLFASQLTQTMLDMPQLCGLLLYTLGLIAYRKTTKNLFILMASVGLTIFIGSKIGVLAPILLIGGLFFLPLKNWKAWATLLITSAILYTGLYLPYFLQGHTPIEWLKNQKWMITFYRTSNVAFFGWNLPAVVFTGWHWGWWDKSWSAVGEWSILWPVTFGSLLLGWKHFKTLDNNWRGILVMSTLFMVSFLILPFWPRYLILVLPFSAYFLAKTIRHYPITNQLTLAVGILLLTISSQLPLAEPVAGHVADRWAAQAYPEIYGTLSQASQEAFTRGEFVTLIASAEQGMQSEKITAYAELNQKSLWQSTQTGTLYIVRQTPLGLVTHAHPIQLVRERGRWRVRWDWQLVAPFYEPGSHFTVVQEQLPYGTVKTSDNIAVIQPANKEILFVKPALIKKEPADLQKITLLTGLREIDILPPLFVTAYNAPLVRIGPVVQDIGQDTLETAKTDPAYLWAEEPTAFFLEELRGIEYSPWLKQFVAQNPKLQSLSAGSLILTLPDESIKILKETPGKKGEDILLPETYDELKQRIVRELR